MRNLLVAAIVGMLAIPLVGLAQQPRSADPSISASRGVRVRGWRARLDQAGGSLRELSFVSMESGFHITTGPAAIFWQPVPTSQTLARGEYRFSATFTQTQPSNHPNGYGLLFGGSHLSMAYDVPPSANTRPPEYSYFLVREDGQFLVRHRIGPETPVLVDWTAHAAVNKLDAQGQSTNTLTVDVEAERVRFLVNGAEVASQPRSALGTDGIVGLRVNHFLDVHVEDLEVTQDPNG